MPFKLLYPNDCGLGDTDEMQHETFWALKQLPDHKPGKKPAADPGFTGRLSEGPQSEKALRVQLRKCYKNKLVSVAGQQASIIAVNTVALTITPVFTDTTGCCIK